MDHWSDISEIPRRFPLFGFPAFYPNFSKVVRSDNVLDIIYTTITLGSRCSAFNVGRVGNAGDVVEKEMIATRFIQSGGFLCGFMGTHLNIVATGSNSADLV